MRRPAAAIFDRSVVCMSDVLDESDYEFAEAKTYAVGFGTHVLRSRCFARAAIGAITRHRRRTCDVLRPTDRHAPDLRRPGGHRDREHAAVQGAAVAHAGTRALGRAAACAGRGKPGGQLDARPGSRLSTIVAQAVELSSADGGAVYEFDEATGEFRPRATDGYPQDLVETLLATPLRKGEGEPVGRPPSVQPVQIPDLRAEGAYTGPAPKSDHDRGGARAALAGSADARGAYPGQPCRFAQQQSGEFPPEVVDLLQTFAASVRRWRSRTRGCSARSSRRAASSRSRASTSRSSSPT